MTFIIEIRYIQYLFWYFLLYFYVVANETLRNYINKHNVNFSIVSKNISKVLTIINDRYCISRIDYNFVNKIMCL